MIELSEDQQAAFNALNDWLDEPDDLMTLGGYAGTGKTTLVGALVESRPDVRFVCCAFTGRAARNLATRLEGRAPSSTIHRLIYNAVPGRSGDIVFTRKKRGELEADVILVDEASMVSQHLFDDLASFGKPILAVGDHGQLPPVSDDGDPGIMIDPRLRLDKIHRQAEASPIIRLSQVVRDRGMIPIPPPAGIRYIPWSKLESELEQVDDFSNTVVLTLKNATRVAANKMVRELRWGVVDSDDPRIGDTVVCLRNDADTGVFNGMRGVVRERTGKNILGVQFPEENMYCASPVAMGQFDHVPDRDKPSPRPPRGTLSFDYGYAMTVHKAQGSGFSRVYLVRERGRGDEDTWARWAYTGVTRAINELIIVAK